MPTNQLNSGPGQSRVPNMSALGILFFMIGAPNVYAFLNRRTESPQLSSTPRYTWFALVAMAIAGIVELSLI
ncbi:MAG: hypothetical protein AAFQ89_16940 [Cyanobacteria bacterium J06626_18]